MLEVDTNPVLSALDALSLPPPEGKPNLLGTTLDDLQRFAIAAGEWDPLESTCRHASLSIL